MATSDVAFLRKLAEIKRWKHIDFNLSSPLNNKTAVKLLNTTCWWWKLLKGGPLQDQYGTASAAWPHQTGWFLPPLQFFGYLDQGHRCNCEWDLPNTQFIPPFISFPKDSQIREIIELLSRVSSLQLWLRRRKRCLQGSWQTSGTPRWGEFASKRKSRRKAS